MNTLSTLDNTVALVRHRLHEDFLARALDLCQGLKGLTSQTRIFIKPNLVFWDDFPPFPPYEMLTTTRMMEALLIL